MVSPTFPSVHSSTHSRVKSSHCKYCLSIRLYSTKSFKALGTLRYHKTSIQCIALAHPTEITETASKRTEELSTRVYEEENEDSDYDEISASDREKVSRWLIAGGKDTRVSIWELMSFEAAGTPAR